MPEIQTKFAELYPDDPITVNIYFSVSNFHPFSVRLLWKQVAVEKIIYMYILINLYIFAYMDINRYIIKIFMSCGYIFLNLLSICCLFSC